MQLFIFMMKKVWSTESHRYRKLRLLDKSGTEKGEKILEERRKSMGEPKAKQASAEKKGNKQK